MEFRRKKISTERNTRSQVVLPGLNGKKGLGTGGVDGFSSTQVYREFTREIHILLSTCSCCHSPTSCCYAVARPSLIGHRQRLVVEELRGSCLSNQENCLVPKKAKGLSHT